MTARFTVILFALLWLVPAAGAEPSVSPSSAPAPGFPQLVTDIQIMLKELGYRPGTPDGKMGSRTRRAIKRYQNNAGMTVNGHPSEGLREHLLVATARTGPSEPEIETVSAKASPSISQRQVIWRGKIVQDSLLRNAPAGAAPSIQHLKSGTQVGVLRRKASWLEVRVGDTAEGWVKFASVRSLEQATAAPAKQKKSGGFFAGFSNLARGVTKLLGGSDPSQDQGTVTVGVRGLAAEDLASASPDPEALETMDGYRADSEQAYRFAAEAKLSAQTVEYLPEPEAVAEDTGAEEQGAPPPSSGARD